MAGDVVDPAERFSWQARTGRRSWSTSCQRSATTEPLLARSPGALQRRLRVRDAPLHLRSGAAWVPAPQLPPRASRRGTCVRGRNVRGRNVRCAGRRRPGETPRTGRDTGAAQPRVGKLGAPCRTTRLEQTRWLSPFSFGPVLRLPFRLLYTPGGYMYNIRRLPFVVKCRGEGIIYELPRVGGSSAFLVSNSTSVACFSSHTLGFLSSVVVRPKGKPGLALAPGGHDGLYEEAIEW